MSDDANLHHNIEDGFDFILSHLQEPIFPRKIMTNSLGYQVEVFNRQEALEHTSDQWYNQLNKVEDA